METFITAREFVRDPEFKKRRTKALENLDISSIDRPITDIVSLLSMIPYCYTIQSCYGHFVHSGQRDLYGVEKLANYKEGETVKYRIAYLAICIELNESGMELLKNLQSVVQIDHEYIQFGSVGWFLRKHFNSYALQVEPERFKLQDTATVSINEAIHLQTVRDRMFEEIREIALRHRGMIEI